MSKQDLAAFDALFVRPEKKEAKYVTSGERAGPYRLLARSDFQFVRPDSINWVDEKPLDENGDWKGVELILLS